MASFYNRFTVRIHLYVFLAISALAMVINRGFELSTNSFFTVPQFRAAHDFENIINSLDKVALGWYYAFFITDFVWAPIMLWLTFRVIYHVFKNPIKVTWFFIISAAAAYAFDILENLTYMGVLNHEHIQVFINVKMVFYGVSAVIFLGFLIKEWKNSDSLGKGVTIFLKTAYFSLLVIVIMVGLLTLTGQGSTIIVDLFYKPVNLAGVYALVMFTAVSLSHFPVYLEARKLPKSITWCIDTKWIIPPRLSLGWGIIYYEDPQPFPFDRIARYLRHHLGTLFICAFIYVQLFVANKFFEGYWISPSWSFTLFLISIWLYYKMNGWLSAKADKQAQSIGWILLLITLVLIALSVALSAVNGWSRLGINVSVLATLSVLVLYMYFRIARKKIVFGNNLLLIRTTATLGFISIIPLIIANANLSFAINHLSPLVILLLYLSNFYGAIVIVTKHIQFYNEDETCKDPESDRIRKKYGLYKYVLPTLVAFLVLWSIISGTMVNDLHRLPLADNKEEHMPLKEFTSEVPVLQRDTLKRYFEVASYGGGLKAALWNLNVLNELQECTKGDFLQATVAMSGNSGGASGMGSYASMWGRQVSGISPDKKAPVLWDSIYAYGMFNHVSIDLTYLLGRDFVREFLPFFKYEGHDRSYKASEQYARLTGMTHLEFKGKSYQNYWRSIYTSSSYYPALITNSAGTSGRQGIAFSLEAPNDFNKIFPGAVNLLNEEECNEHKTITYFGAISTSNRFPIFSPSAEVPGVGHFLDGGYFDNSGLTSLLGFQKYLERMYPDSLPFNRKPVFVIIDNSTERYLAEVIENKLKACKDVTATGELSAVLQTLTYIDKIPKYMEGYIRNEYEMIRINLPQPLDYDEVVSMLKGHPYNPTTIMELIEESNKRIDSVLVVDDDYKYDKWGRVNPPLARLISEPGVYYMKAMVKHHPDVLEKIDSIKVKLYGYKNP